MTTPWKAVEGRSNYRYEVADAEGQCVARVVGGVFGPAKVNANLLAAAPDLRDALVETAAMVCNDRCDGNHDARCFRARAAIAKAEGRLPKGEGQ